MSAQEALKKTVLQLEAASDYFLDQQRIAQAETTDIPLTREQKIRLFSALTQMTELQANLFRNIAVNPPRRVEPPADPSVPGSN